MRIKQTRGSGVIRFSQEMILFVVFWSILIIGVNACSNILGGDEDKDQPKFDVSGTWELEHHNNVSTQFGSQFATTTLTLELSQNGNEISGSHRDGIQDIINSIAGRFVSVIPGGSVSGTIKSEQITLHLDYDDDGETEELNGQVINASEIEGEFITTSVGSLSWSAERK